MKLPRTIFLSTAVTMLVGAFAATLPQVNGDIIVFADGFAIQGQVKEATTFIVDPASGGSIRIPKQGEPFWLDDGVRNIRFTPFQIKEAQKDRAKKADQVKFAVHTTDGRNPLPVSWAIETAGKWDEHWEREVILDVGGKKVKVKQRITLLTPESIKVESSFYDWVMSYNTKEFDPETLRSLVYQYLSKKKEKDTTQRETVYRFLLQAGFVEQAEKELEDMLRAYPMQESNITPQLQAARRIYALQLVEALQRSHTAGLHSDVEHKLALYAKRQLDDLLDEKTQLQVQALKNKYAAAKAKQQEAVRLLHAFAEVVPPGQVQICRNAAAAITQELNFDTVDRLDTFLSLAADYERALKTQRKPEQSPADVMAFALTGWLRGSSAAERNIDVAVKQWEIRELLLQYLRTDDPLARKNKWLPALKAVSVDEAMQMIRRLPPVEPFDNLGAKPQQLESKNDGHHVSYQLQLPPGYHHGRLWPVLITLHHSQEKASDAAARWASLAGQHGYIVAAPQWGKGAKNAYQFTAAEHLAVLETLRDLRRRFNVDSDRVFLFGAEQGGNMAFDVGLAHPDQFAGVIPMAGTPLFFARRYWPNARHLPVYIVNGEKAGVSVKETQALFKDFTRANFPAIAVEYKGRPAEWFFAEQPTLFDWMNRKRRALPLKELGRQDEEFKTQRTIDNQFYWLSTSQINPACLNAAAGWNAAIKPATLRASVFANNEIHVKTTGVGQVTLWFVPNLVNYGEPVTVRLNGSAPSKRMVTPDLGTLLETLYYTGDRQRMYLARLDMKA